MAENANSPRVSIVIPAYNEAQSLGRVLRELGALALAGGHETLVVDDGSTDGTAQAAEAQTGVRVLRHKHNRGYGAALKTGIRAARGEIVVLLDSDGQHAPADVPRLLAALDAETDMVVGARASASQVPWQRRPGKALLGWIANYLAGQRIPDLNSGFRAIRRRVIRRFFHILPNGFSFSTTSTLALLKGGYEVAYVPIVAAPRVGTSQVSIVRDGLQTLLLIVRTIALFDPLKVFVPASLLQLAVGLGYIVYETIDKASVKIAPGAQVLLVAALLSFLFGILADQVSELRLSARSDNHDEGRDP
jgi:glycosyltransferase involved in cell wall biosynthesis